MLDYEWATMHRSMYLRKERAYSYNVATFYLVSRGNKIARQIFSVMLIGTISSLHEHTNKKKTDTHHSDN